VGVLLTLPDRSRLELVGADESAAASVTVMFNPSREVTRSIRRTSARCKPAVMGEAAVAQ
jgi:hypothetical protein